MLLKEYLLSGDISEAEHCLKELEVPHFHHELVYEVRLHSHTKEDCQGFLHHSDQCLFNNTKIFFLKYTKMIN